MALPWLKHKHQAAGISVQYRKPDENMAEGGEADQDHGLRAAAKDLMAAIHSNDSEKLMHALKAAFEILDSQPHEEGPHLNENEESEQE